MFHIPAAHPHAVAPRSIMTDGAAESPGQDGARNRTTAPFPATSAAAFNYATAPIPAATDWSALDVMDADAAAAGGEEDSYGAVNRMDALWIPLPQVMSCCIHTDSSAYHTETNNSSVSSGAAAAAAAAVGTGRVNLTPARARWLSRLEPRVVSPSRREAEARAAAARVAAETMLASLTTADP